MISWTAQELRRRGRTRGSARVSATIWSAYFLLLCIQGASAQEDPSGGANSRPAQRVIQARTPSGSVAGMAEEDLADHWFRYRNYVANDLSERVAGELTELVALQKQAQIPRAIEISDAMVFEGYGYLDDGELDKARVMFNSAILLDRYQGEAYASLAWLSIRESSIAIWPFTKYSALALRYSAAAFWDRFALAANSVLLLAFGLSVGFTMLAVILVVKHGSLLYHDVHEAHASGRGSESRTRLLLAVVLGLPLILFMGVWWASCYWMLLLWVYLGARERALAIAMLVFALVLPAGTAVYRLLYTAYRDPAVQLLVASRSASDPRRLLQMLKSYTDRHPDDADVKFVLGNHYLRAGRYEDALSIYQGINATNHGYQIALVNMGNVLFHLRDFENAIKRYESALAIDSSSPLINYNIKAAYSERFDFAMADEYMRRAQAIDSKAVDRLSSQTVMKVADEEFTTRKIAIRMLTGTVTSGRETDPSIASELARRPEMRAVLTSAYYPLLFGLLVAGGLAAMQRSRAGIALGCLKCGRAFCKRCQRGVGRDRYCSQCAHIFIVKDGISEDARNRKFQEIQSFSTAASRRNLILSLILPGSEQVMRDRSIAGFLTMTLWLFLLAVAFLDQWQFSRAIPFAVYTERLTSGLAVFAVFLYYGIYNGRNILNPSRLQG